MNHFSKNYLIHNPFFFFFGQLNAQKCFSIFHEQIYGWTFNGIVRVINRDFYRKPVKRSHGGHMDINNKIVNYSNKFVHFQEVKEGWFSLMRLKCSNLWFQQKTLIHKQMS